MAKTAELAFNEYANLPMASNTASLPPSSHLRLAPPCSVLPHPVTTTLQAQREAAAGMLY